MIMFTSKDKNFQEYIQLWWAEGKGSVCQPFTFCTLMKQVMVGSFTNAAQEVFAEEPQVSQHTPSIQS
jgi:hypothetical protein